MSALGQKQTLEHVRVMSALGQKQTLEWSAPLMVDRFRRRF